VEGVLALWQRMKEESRLRRLAASVVFIEQPIKRYNALSADISALAKEKPVIIDESDDSLDAFPRAKALGYRGVSSKTCKGLYKSIINAARCAEWGADYFMTGEDLTLQAGLAIQQDLALVSLLGLTHVERNGHHYVNGMTGLPVHEQDAFLQAHPDLSERSHRAGGVALKDGTRLMPDPLLVGRNAAKVEELARKHGVQRWTTDLDAALRSKDDQVFFDAASTQLRPKLLKRAIAAGKHVYCEKPVA